jgi:hypothetical protein
MLTGRLDQGPGIDAADDLRDVGAGEGLILLLTKCVAQKLDRRPKDAADLAERLAELWRPAPPSVPAAHPVRPPVNVKPAGPGNQPGQPPAPPKLFEPTPLEGGAIPISPMAPAPRAAPAPPEPVVKSAKWLIPFRASWFARSTTTPDAAWAPQAGRLPGEVTVKPTEAYRLALPPDDTTDATLAKFRAIADLPNLEAVDLSGCAKVTDAGLAHLAALPGLKAIGLADTAVTDSGVALLLTGIPNLEAVGLAGAERVSAAVVPYLTRLRQLKIVSLPPRADSVDVRRELAKRLPGCKLV